MDNFSAIGRQSISSPRLCIGSRNDKPMMVSEACEVGPVGYSWVYVAVISLPLASLPSSANPARNSETTTTVIASTAG